MSRRAAGAAFSWISSDAEVWRTNSVTRPVAMPLAETKRATRSVNSTSPWPWVAISIVSLAWFISFLLCAGLPRLCRRGYTECKWGVAREIDGDEGRARLAGPAARRVSGGVRIGRALSAGQRHAGADRAALYGARHDLCAGGRSDLRHARLCQLVWQ